MRNEIVVGLDNSASSKAALNWAAEQANSTGTVLRAVHVLDWPYGLSTVGFPAPLNYMDVRREEIEDSYREAIVAEFEAVSPALDWILQFASGDAGHILVEQSKDARLLVVGTREHAGLRRLLSSSVSHYCLRHAACPVVAVPAYAADRRTEDAETVGPDIAAEVGDLETVIPAPEVIDEAELPGKTLLVAGVDASAESLAAAHYAVTAAELRGNDVLLVHAYPPAAAGAAGEAAAARATADKLLAAVAAQLIVPPHMHVYTKAEPDDAVTVLKESASRAAMLVVGRDHASWGQRLLMGAVASQVVNQVACPLVVVPGGWRPRHAWPRLPVIVALASDSPPEPALRLAFEEARLRDARLVVLHAEPMSASHRDVSAAKFDLGEVLAEWKQDHADVAISTAFVSGDPDAQLLRWSRSAAVLVVGHPHQRRWGSWTRSVARSVMKQTHCPLIMAPQATADSGEHRPLAEQALG
ncbi:MAG TPA: universal stress protein [Propionibacteriaceae bacterium]|nr:universal stress protein [Propionibacteriaceae bacterium]